MLKGFRDFVLRGNVIDLAVGVIIGAAFTAIVTAFTGHIIQPLINAIGKADYNGWGFFINPDKRSTFVDLGAVLTAVINFLIVAAVVYFVIVLPINTLTKRLKKEEPDAPAALTDVEVLTQIRDILVATRGDAVPVSSNGAQGTTVPDGSAEHAPKH